MKQGIESTGPRHCLPSAESTVPHRAVSSRTCQATLERSNHRNEDFHRLLHLLRSTSRSRCPVPPKPYRSMPVTVLDNTD